MNRDEAYLKYKNIPWREIEKLRNIVAHKYHSLNMERIWTTVKKDVPELKKQILFILRDIETT